MKRFLPSLLLASLPVWCQTSNSPLPNDQLPNHGKAAFTFTTRPNSFQIYTCVKNSDVAFGWQTDPDAVMTDAHRHVVHHYHGPTWELPDGSIIHSEGPKAIHYLPVKTPDNPDPIHWLQLPGEGGTGQFAKITVVQRVDTVNGTSPKPTDCGAGNTGEQRRVKYSATYRFYVK
jgi:hypothetical protein